VGEGSSLERLREEVREVTLEVIRLAGRRLALAREIGEIKRRRALPIEDLEVERELRRLVLKECQICGVDDRFGLKLLDLLTVEAKRVQGVR